MSTKQRIDPVSKPVSGTTTHATADIGVIDLNISGEIGESLTSLALRRLRRDYLTLFSIVIVLLLVLLSLFAPLICDALGISYKTTNAPAFMPIGSEGHILGTDDLGRDELARLLYAGRVSLSIAAAAALGSLVIGISVGVFAGYHQGGPLNLFDDAIMWFVTTINSVPTLFLLLIVAAVLRQYGDSLSVFGMRISSVFYLIFLLTILGWTGTMRLVRGETLVRRELEYVISARATGAGATRIMFVHILPNVFSIIIVTLAIDIGSLILTESALSYLGLGVQPPTPSWGNMLNNAQSLFNRGEHLVFLPGSLIVLTVLCLYIIGDGLRDAFDPQSVRQR